MNGKLHVIDYPYACQKFEVPVPFPYEARDQKVPREYGVTKYRYVRLLVFQLPSFLTLVSGHEGLSTT